MKGLSGQKISVSSGAASYFGLKWRMEFCAFSAILRNVRRTVQYYYRDCRTESGGAILAPERQRMARVETPFNQSGQKLFRRK